jgi:hypothetical protein
MNTTNRTLPKFSAWQIGVAIIATICTVNSATAQVQFANEESSSVSLQSSNGVTHGDFSESWLSKATNRLPCCGHRGRACGVVAGVKQSAAMLSHRETPLGDMGLHFPYHATQMYYYRRPYNDHHVRRQLEQSLGSLGYSALGGNLGYSNQVFQDAHQSVEGYLNSEGIKLEEDGLLEYTDWKQHQLNRLTWETPPRYQADAEDLSLPMEEEEVEATQATQATQQTQAISAIQATQQTQPTQPTQEVSNKKTGSRVSFFLTDRSDRPSSDLRALPEQLEEGFSAIRALPALPSVQSP